MILLTLAKALVNLLRYPPLRRAAPLCHLRRQTARTRTVSRTREEGDVIVLGCFKKINAEGRSILGNVQYHAIRVVVNHDEQ
mmetsp:Transcript_15804/g.23126  ORF Transcript_15804/g.23126 Transcript_15804/m.23126 type:complete len:82 (-) Transcript_15804:68-313(-)